MTRLAAFQPEVVQQLVCTVLTYNLGGNMNDTVIITTSRQ
jgi:hypothetical protein